jgi:hypothetical protein
MFFRWWVKVDRFNGAWVAIDASNRHPVLEAECQASTFVAQHKAAKSLAKARGAILPSFCAQDSKVSSDMADECNLKP